MKCLSLRRFGIVIAWLGLGWGAPVFGASLVFGSVSDTSIYENKADSNLGATTLLSGTNHQFSRSRAMFRFDLGTLPAGAVVTGVQVQLYVTRQPDPDQHGGPVASDFSLHRMFVSWGEGSGASNTGSGAMAGDATWNDRHFQAIAWGNPGGLIGTDYADTASATTSIGDVGSYVWGSSPELIADVQSWVADPSMNFGFILVNESEGSPGSARRFASREAPGGDIPSAQLIVTFTVPEPGTSLLVAAGLTGAMLRRARRTR